MFWCCELPGHISCCSFPPSSSSDNWKWKTYCPRSEKPCSAACGCAPPAPLYGFAILTSFPNLHQCLVCKDELWRKGCRAYVVQRRISPEGTGKLIKWKSCLAARQVLVKRAAQTRSFAEAGVRCCWVRKGPAPRQMELGFFLPYPNKGCIFCSPGNESGSQAVQERLILPPLSFCGRWKMLHGAFISAASFICLLGRGAIQHFPWGSHPKIPLLLQSPTPTPQVCPPCQERDLGSFCVRAPSPLSPARHDIPSSVFMVFIGVLRALDIWLVGWTMILSSQSSSAPNAWKHHILLFFSGGKGMKTKSRSLHFKCTQAPSLGHRWQSSWITLVWRQNV